MGLLGRLTHWETQISLIAKADTSDIFSQLKKSPHALLVPCGTTFFVKPSENWEKSGDPNGSRTRVSTVKEWCPRPLDDGVADQAE